jgi:hypothetical protein
MTVTDQGVTSYDWVKYDDLVQRAATIECSLPDEWDL